MFERRVICLCYNVPLMGGDKLTGQVPRFESPAKRYRFRLQLLHCLLLLTQRLFHICHDGLLSLLQLCDFMLRVLPVLARLSHQL